MTEKEPKTLKFAGQDFKFARRTTGEWPSDIYERGNPGETQKAEDLH